MMHQPNSYTNKMVAGPWVQVQWNNVILNNYHVWLQAFETIWKKGGKIQSPIQATHIVQHFPSTAAGLQSFQGPLHIWVLPSFLHHGFHAVQCLGMAHCQLVGQELPEVCCDLSFHCKTRGKSILIQLCQLKPVMSIVQYLLELRGWDELLQTPLALAGAFFGQQRSQELFRTFALDSLTITGKFPFLCLWIRTIKAKVGLSIRTTQIVNCALHRHPQTESILHGEYEGHSKSKHHGADSRAAGGSFPKKTSSQKHLVFANCNLSTYKIHTTGQLFM